MTREERNGTTPINPDKADKASLGVGDERMSATLGAGVLIATKAGLLAVYSGPDRVVKQALVTRG